MLHHEHLKLLEHARQYSESYVLGLIDGEQ